MASLLVLIFILRQFFSFGLFIKKKKHKVFYEILTFAKHNGRLLKKEPNKHVIKISTRKNDFSDMIFTFNEEHELSIKIQTHSIEGVSSLFHFFEEIRIINKLMAPYNQTTNVSNFIEKR